VAAPSGAAKLNRSQLDLEAKLDFGSVVYDLVRWTEPTYDVVLMRLTILGTRGNVPRSAPGYARHSGILVDDRILLDLGEMAYLRYRPQHIFVTHLHPDHAAFLRTGMITDAEVYLPEPTRKLPNARVISRPVQPGSYRIVPVPTIHSLKVRSVGYVVERGGCRIFFSSDLVAIERRYHRRLRRLDLVITEGSYIRRGGLVRTDPVSGRPFGHTGIPNLIEFFRPFTPRIIITHFGSWFYQDIAAATQRITSLGGAVRTSAAHDGLVIDIYPAMAKDL
jgi:phosphoribosyl 1,2-cyclic phosphodiesterase